MSVHVVNCHTLTNCLRLVLFKALFILTLEGCVFFGAAERENCVKGRPTSSRETDRPRTIMSGHISLSLSLSDIQLNSSSIFYDNKLHMDTFMIKWFITVKFFSFNFSQYRKTFSTPLQV